MSLNFELIMANLLFYLAKSYNRGLSRTQSIFGEPRSTRNKPRLGWSEYVKRIRVPMKIFIRKSLKVLERGSFMIEGTL